MTSPLLLQGLLGLKQLDIYEIAHSKSDAARLLSEIDALHSREVAATSGPYTVSSASRCFIADSARHWGIHRAGGQTLIQQHRRDYC